MKADELVRKILNKEIVSGTGIKVITPCYETEYYFWGNWFGTKYGDKSLDNIELHLCDPQTFFEIIEERPKEIELLNENGFHNNQKVLARKINELINEVNLLKKEEDKK